jgi:hypothetical protein
MSNAHPMTKPYALATLDGFKARIDRAIDNVANALDDAVNLSHKRVGGIHFVKLGRINLNVSVSKPVVEEPTTVDLTARISRFVR